MTDSVSLVIHGASGWFWGGDQRVSLDGVIRCWIWGREAYKYMLI